MSDDRMQRDIEELAMSRLNRRRLLQGIGAAGAVAGLGGTMAQATLAQDTAAPSGALQLGGESEPAGSWLPYRASGGAETQVFDLIFSRLIR
ncbi:MAG: twin-arginine translocation signal domain-containing protein, partial [Thermomicrobiales bacterium]|nr:twin-arginine translocation signal domain-containing protein [Thermomicrobiales bacterium]